MYSGAPAGPGAATELCCLSLVLSLVLVLVAGAEVTALPRSHLEQDRLCDCLCKTQKSPHCRLILFVPWMVEVGVLISPMQMSRYTIT